MRHIPPYLITASDTALPPSRYTSSDSLGTATVSMSCLTVAILDESRRSLVGGPSPDDGKTDAGLTDVPGISANAGDDADGAEEGTPALRATESGVGIVPDGGCDT